MSGNYRTMRYHDISCGHRVAEHEGKCQHLHGHNYRVHFVCEALFLDKIGRIIDFSVIKEKLCMWLENNWDHRFLIWEKDLMSSFLIDIDKTVVKVPFNPTAENMAHHLVTVVGPEVLKNTGVTLVSVMIEETAKCHASYSISQGE